jgi:hypothetical protein
MNKSDQTAAVVAGIILEICTNSLKQEYMSNYKQQA